MKAVSALAPLAMLFSAAPGWAGETSVLFEPYALELAEETALARSAAPENISGEASVWLLGETGYYMQEEGANGFHCTVLRSWSAPYKSPDITPELQSWPGLVAPICYDSVAAEGDMKEQFLRARLYLEGKSLDEVREAVFSAYSTGELQPIRTTGFAYMMSAGQDLAPGLGNWHPHFMIYAPYANADAFSNAFNSGLPIEFEGAGTARAAFIVPLAPGAQGDHLPVHPGVSTDLSEPG